MSRKQKGKEKRDGTDRRDFLKLAGLGGIAGSAAIVAGEGEAVADEPAGRGYRESDHVRKYYELARF